MRMMMHVHVVKRTQARTITYLTYRNQYQFAQNLHIVTLSRLSFVRAADPQQARFRSMGLCAGRTTIYDGNCGSVDLDNRN